MGGMYEYIKSKFTGNGIMDDNGNWRELEYRRPPKSNQFGDRASEELSMLPKHLVLLPADKRQHPSFIKVPLRVGNAGNTFNRLFEANPEEELRGDNSALEAMEVYEFRGMFNGPWLDRDTGGITHQLFQKDAPSAIARTRSHGSQLESREVLNWGYTTATEFNSGNQKISPTASGVWDQRYTTEMVRESLDKIRVDDGDSRSEHSREFNNLVRTFGRSPREQAARADQGGEFNQRPASSQGSTNSSGRSGAATPIRGEGLTGQLPLSELEGHNGSSAMDDTQAEAEGKHRKRTAIRERTRGRPDSEGTRGQ
jgi:hypothetical protein